jgi:hypothetical protein
MARYVVTVPVTIAATDYQHPARVHFVKQVVELSAAEVTAIGAGNLRTVATTTMHDTLGLGFAVSNGS